jgi:hypothetical protein
MTYASRLSPTIQSDKRAYNTTFDNADKPIPRRLPLKNQNAIALRQILAGASCLLS